MKGIDAREAQRAVALGREILERGKVGIGDVQEFHRFLDKQKGFSPDMFLNVALLVEELGEVVKETRALLWDSDLSDHDREQVRGRIGEELADCLAYLAKLANYAGADLEAAYLTKMHRNIERNWKR